MKILLKNSVYFLMISILFSFDNKNEKEEQFYPNIVLIVADDLGWRDLHCYGNELVETPNLDKLADDGILFSTAYASSPVCSPTRASLLTGKNPVAVDITDYIPGKQYERQIRGIMPKEKFIVPEFNHELSLEETTLAEILKSNGYATVSIGKWHLGGNGYLPTEQGFDDNIGGNHMGLPPSYYYPYTAERFNFDITHLELTKDSIYLTDRLGNEAVEFIDENSGKPFFLYLPFYTVHTPWEGRPDLVKKYEEIIAESDDAIQRDPQFLAMIESLDINAGKVIDALEEKGLSENTFVIFVSDNGGLNGKRDNIFVGSYNRPLRGGKATLYEGGLRVPTIFKWPGKIPAGQVSDELIISTDIFSTVIDALGLSPRPDIEGVSLWPHLTTGESLDRERFYWHYPHYHNRTGPGSVIRDGDYKLIHFYEDRRSELYNLKEDVSEENDLSSEMPVKVKELEEKLNTWLQGNRAKLPKPNKDYTETEQ